MHSGLSALYMNFLVWVACSTILISCAGYLAPICPELDLLNHWRVQYAILLFVLSVLLSLLRHRLLPVMCLACGINLFEVASAYRPEAIVNKATHSICILDMNVCCENDDPPLLTREIERNQADIVVLEELTDPLWQSMRVALRNYPFYVTCNTQSERGFGMGIFSKFPLVSASRHPLSSMDGISALSAVFVCKQRPIQLLTIHPTKPLCNATAAVSQKMVRNIAQSMNAFQGSKILIGDFNATPWSIFFRQIRAETSLHDSARAAGGWQGTWPTYMPLLYIPIDHCLTSGDCRVVERSSGPYIGSDHRPICVRLLVP